ncbi:hypothetical protein G6F63_016122 [Rhizopus arrhizus]|nr:hypothetical protein G6F63_016122 [Rhizopus arrhizus]
MPQAQCFGLGHEDRTHALRKNVADQLQLFLLAGALELLFQLVGLVEIVGDCMLVAVGDEHQRIAAGLDGFIHGVLDQRPINDRQHLLRHGLGCWQKTRPQPCHRENRFADSLAHWYLLASRAGKGRTLADEM